MLLLKQTFSANQFLYMFCFRNCSISKVARKTEGATVAFIFLPLKLYFLALSILPVNSFPSVVWFLGLSEMRNLPFFAYSQSHGCNFWSIRTKKSGKNYSTKYLNAKLHPMKITLRYPPERRRGLMAINHQARQSQNVNVMVLGSLCKGVFELHASTGSEGALLNLY